ncbi:MULTISPECIES: hypothetical protein [Listeria]|uniref:hypothetical protein n=1 Tax=Listeria TaxID=1637 RepID=UPI000B596657|nr:MULTISPECIES: hypothetical protein [Listeria]
MTNKPSEAEPSSNKKVNNHTQKSTTNPNIINSEWYKIAVNQVYPDFTKQQCTLTANKLYNFIHNMSIGDFVIVPGKRSDFFAIGIIYSDVLEVNDSFIAQSKINNKYKICDFYKRRKVIWIKEVKRKNLSEKLYWLLSAHQSLFDLTSSANLIIPLIAPIYTYKKNINSSIYITTTKNVNNDTWFYLHSAIKNIALEKSKHIDIKINVQSPGIAFLESTLQHWPEIVAVASFFFGKVDAKSVKFQGIVPYFFGEGRLDRELKRLEIEHSKKDLETKEVMNNNLKKDGESKDIDNLFKRQELTRVTNKSSTLLENYKKPNLSELDINAIKSLKIEPSPHKNDSLNKQDNFSLSTSSKEDDATLTDGRLTNPSQTAL